MSLDRQLGPRAGKTLSRVSLLFQMAHVLSLILHPAVPMLTVATFLSAAERDHPLLVVLDLAVLLAGILPGLVYILVRTKRGHFTHYHLLLKEERYTVFPILLLGLMGSYISYRWLEAPPALAHAALLGVTGGVGAAIISRYWKISMHAAVPMGCSALLFSEHPLIAIGIAALGIIAGIARLPIKHHSVTQVIGGWLYGFGITYVVAHAIVG